MSTVAVTVTMGITLPYLALVQEGWGVDPDGMFLNPHLQAIFG